MIEDGLVACGFCGAERGGVRVFVVMGVVSVWSLLRSECGRAFGLNFSAVWTGGAGD